jgi:CBS domain-containing protein
MMILSYLTFDYPHLSPQDSVQKALNTLNRFKKKALPVVKDKLFLGNIDLDILGKCQTPEIQLKDLVNELSDWKMESEEDLLASIPIFDRSNYDLLAVVDDDQKWLGYLDLGTLHKELFQTGFNSENGGIIRIPFHAQRDKFSQIVRIIEEEKGLVVRSYLKEKGDQYPELVIQVESNQFAAMIQSLERHGFMVEKAFRFGIQKQEGESARFDLLMKYLNP